MPAKPSDWFYLRAQSKRLSICWASMLGQSVRLMRALRLFHDLGDLKTYDSGSGSDSVNEMWRADMSLITASDANLSHGGKADLYQDPFEEIVCYDFISMQVCK